MFNNVASQQVQEHLTGIRNAKSDEKKIFDFKNQKQAIITIFLLFCVASSKSIIIYNEETLITLSFAFFVMFCYFNFGNTVKQALDDRSYEIKEAFASYHRLKKESTEQLLSFHKRSLKLKKGLPFLKKENENTLSQCSLSWLITVTNSLRKLIKRRCSKVVTSLLGKGESSLPKASLSRKDGTLESTATKKNKTRSSTSSTKKRTRGDNSNKKSGVELHSGRPEVSFESLSAIEIKKMLTNPVLQKKQFSTQSIALYNSFSERVLQKLAVLKLGSGLDQRLQNPIAQYLKNSVISKMITLKQDKKSRQVSKQVKQGTTRLFGIR